MCLLSGFGVGSGIVNIVWFLTDFTEVTENLDQNIYD